MLQIAHFVYPIVLIAITAQAQEAPDWARHYDNAFVSSPIVIDGLANENVALRNQQTSLTAERATLIEKTEQARTRVEAMIARLKAMETRS